MIPTAQTVASLYVHVPFCAHKCEYCAFYSAPPAGDQVNRYVDALVRELEIVAPELRPATVFFGGGTPSLLNLRQWRKVFEAMDRLNLLGASEWTVECNPATVSLDKARLLRDHGVNRLSLGVQSLDEQLLDRLGRAHSREMVFKSFDLLRRAGFDNLNVDLMFAIPGQTLEMWKATLAEATALGSEHLSTYEVTCEEDTPLFAQLRAGEFAVDEDLADDMYQALLDTVAANGFEQYEVSNFARNQRRPRTPSYSPGREETAQKPFADCGLGPRRGGTESDGSAGFQPAVPPTSSRREAGTFGQLSCFPTFAGWETCDTADWKSAVRELQPALGLRTAGFQPAVSPASSQPSVENNRSLRIGNPRYSRLEVCAAGGECSEIPAYACRHNVNYWRGGAFFGAGPSAASFVHGVRAKNWSNTNLYCERLEQGRRAIESTDELPPLRRAGEIAAFGLRMNAGWRFAEFERVTGFDLRREWAAEMDRLVALGNAARDAHGFRLTRQGLRFADAAAEHFLR